MSFDQFNLDSRLSAGIKRAGFVKPTPIQQKAIPVAMQGGDLIGTAQTGTGKTAAFVLPILNKLVHGPHKKIRALIVTPTRELADQINDTVRSFAKDAGLRSVTVYGGVGATPQIQAVKRGVEIVVACPGRLLDLVAKGHINLKTVEILVLDEADRMFDMGFLPDIRRIIKLVPNERQTMLFSATFPKEVEQLARQSLRNPQRISVGLSRPAHTVSHVLYPVPQHLKRKLLFELLKETSTDSVLIFTRTKHRARRLMFQLQKANYKVTSLHSNRSQNQRKRALNGFKSGRFQMMVATDIAARGLDVDTISHVINFDMPDTADAYIHRIGRTGRAKRTGDAITLSTPDDEALIRKLERIMKQKMQRLFIEDFDYDVPAPPRQPRQPRRKKRNSNSPSRQGKRPQRSKRRSDQRSNRGS